MNKVELAQYLANLHTLLSAQASGVANPSAVLSAEYDRAWAQLKQEIANETRTSDQQHVRTEDRAELEGGERKHRG